MGTIKGEKIDLTRTRPLGEIERYYKIEKPPIPKAEVSKPDIIESKSIYEIYNRAKGLGEGREAGGYIDTTTGKIINIIDSKTGKVFHMGKRYVGEYAVDLTSNEIVDKVIDYYKATPKSYGQIAEYHYHPIKGGPSVKDVIGWLARGESHGFANKYGLIDDKYVWTLEIPKNAKYDNWQASKYFEAKFDKYLKEQHYGEAMNQALTDLADEYGLKYKRRDMIPYEVPKVKVARAPKPPTAPVAGVTSPVTEKAKTPAPEVKPALPSVKPSPPISYSEYAGLKQSPRGRAMDLARQHSIVIEPDSPKIKSWVKDPGKADVRGIDTKRMRISPKVPRITPKMPRLR